MTIIRIPKKVPSKRVFKTISVGSNHWYNGKLYSPLNNIRKMKRNNIKGAIQLGNSRRFLYTLDSKRRTKGFAPRNLL